MAAIYTTLLIEEEEEREAIPKTVKDRNNPFVEFNDKQFIKRFRVNKELAIYLIQSLEGELQSERMPPFIKVITFVLHCNLIFWFWLTKNIYYFNSCY